ncbi:MAG TPA: Ig-like domain-containing protein [Candidatus Limnocylindria bacterium]|nr:Ig-like domain-containing protein [Candidatus Limnocylindria bacterium]
MPVRVRALPLILALVVSVATSLVLPAAPTVRAAALKVAIIVGPVGDMTDGYRSSADRVASAATAAGATVAKAYSPNATWSKVKTAVSGANVVVYFGHGNGFPNPYSTTENTDRVNGWGLNRTTTNGDADGWSTTLAYCGERALLGTLTSGDDAVRRTYCGGTANDGITPAAGFTMIYAQAHYAPGFGERYDEDDPLTTLSQAQQRVRHYSYPVLRLGARGYIATAYGDADQIVTRVLTMRTTTFADIFRAGRGFSSSTLTTMAHPDVSGAQVWVQRTSVSGLHFGDPDYWYAFAGNPNATPSGAAATTPKIARVYPGANSANGSVNATVSATFDRAVTGVSGSTFSLHTASGQSVPASVTYNAYWKRAELRPSAPMLPGTTYVASLGWGISSSGGSLAPYSWRFTTAGTPPAPEGMEAFDPAVRLAFLQGTHTGYRFDASGAPTAVRTVSLATNSGANADLRGTIAGQSGTWFHIVNGAWAGYWLRQSDAVHLATTSAVSVTASAAEYDPPRRISFRQGTHTGYRFSATGALLAARTVTLATNSGADAYRLAAIPNQHGAWFAIVNGAWAGYWVPASDVIYLP